MVGAFSEESTDYPDHIGALRGWCSGGRPTAVSASAAPECGASITANKFDGIRAALCTNAFMAEMSRRHNDANVLILGARVTEEAEAIAITRTWVDTPFEGGRHQRRLDKIKAIECGRVGGGAYDAASYHTAWPRKTMPVKMLRYALPVLFAVVLTTAAKELFNTVKFGRDGLDLYNVREDTDSSKRRFFAVADLSYRHAGIPSTTDLVLSFNRPAAELVRDDSGQYVIHRAEFEARRGAGTLGGAGAYFFQSGPPRRDPARARALAWGCSDAVRSPSRCGCSRHPFRTARSFFQRSDTPPG